MVHNVPNYTHLKVFLSAKTWRNPVISHDFSIENPNYYPKIRQKFAYVKIPN